MKIITQHCTPQRRSLFPAFTVLRALLVITSSLLGVRTAFAEEPLDRQITINISANTPLEDALIEWGLKARVTVMTNSEVVAHYLTKHVSGTLTARRALALLLEDTHLYYTQNGERIHILPGAAQGLLTPTPMPASNFQPPIKLPGRPTQ